MKLSSNEEKYRKFSGKIRRAVMKADYEKAFKFTEEALGMFPGVPFAVLDHFTVMADYGLTVGGAKGRRLHKKGTEGLLSLMRKLRSFKEEERIIVKNEVYYQTKQFKKQYELGIVEYKKSKKLVNFYSSGVGAAWYANEMFKKGQIKRCQSWAKKAVVAWERYFEYRKNYYNPYVHYALALGFLGRPREMEKALAKAQKLSKKSRNYVEFKEVRGIIKKFIGE